MISDRISCPRSAGAAFTVAAPGRDGVIIYKAIDLLYAGDILVISRVDRDDIACVGGGVAAAAEKAQGACGIVVDGPCTDVDEIVASGVPVWCRGVSSKPRTASIRLVARSTSQSPAAAAAVLPGYGGACGRSRCVRGR